MKDTTRIGEGWIMFDEMTPTALRKCKAANMTDAEIAKLYGVNRSTVQRMRNRHGITQVAKPKVAEHPERCPSCKRYATRYVKGVCASCREYELRFGRPWTERVYHVNKGKLCKRCKKQDAKYKSLCASCYQHPYFNDGRQRPSYKWVEKCQVCGRPNVTLCKGRCPTCHQYWHQMGKERSREIIQRYAPHGFCDCGNPAKHLNVALKLMTTDRNAVYTETFDLCNDCYDAEFMPRATKENLHNR